jgi:hypothetical protein
MAARTGVYNDIATIPSFKNYKQNIQQFLSTEGKKAVHRGTLVATPQQAQAGLKAAAIQMRTDWDNVLRLAKLWAYSLGTYSALNLPSTLSSLIMANASSALGARIDQLNSLSPTERLTVLSDLVVELTASVTTVQAYGSLTPPTTFVLMSGLASAYSDATHPALPATLPSSFYEGYSVYTGHDTMNVLVDDEYNLTLKPPGSFVARIDCPARGPYVLDPTAVTFNIVSAANAENSTDVLTDTVVLIGGTIEPWLVVARIKDACTYATAHLFHSIAKTIQDVASLYTGPGLEDFTLSAPTTWAALSVVPGDTIVVTGANGVDSVWTIDTLAGATAHTHRTSTGVGARPTDTTSLLVSVGTNANIRFYIQLKDATTYGATILGSRESMQLVDVDTGTLAQLSLFSGMTVYSTRTSAAKFAQWVNQGTATMVLGAPRLSASVEFVPTFHTGLGRTNPSNTNLLTFYEASDEAAVISSTTGTTTLQSASVAALGLGAHVVVRESNASADVGKYGTISAVSGPQFTINVNLAGTGTVLVEAATKSAFDITDMRGEYTVVIAEGQLFDGTYTTSTLPAPTPLDIPLSSALQGATGLGGQPVVIRNVQVGQSRLALASEDTTLMSSVSVLDTGNFDEAFVTGPYPRKVLAQTTWVRFTTMPTGFDKGDLFEVYVTSAQVPDVFEEIVDIDASNRLIQLQNPIAASLTGLFCAVTPNLPFAKIRKVVKQNYDTVATNVAAWLETPLVANEHLTFRNLDAALNPLLADSPSMAQATTAQGLLAGMRAPLNTLLDYLAAYSAPPVTDVDSLIKGFLQKGMDRAVDTLLEGDFSTFFAMDSQDVSYVGNLQKTIGAVQVQDFPVRKDNRAHSAYAASEQTIAQYNDVDMGYVMDPTSTYTQAP